MKIKITESQLRRIIEKYTEEVILNEAWYDDALDFVKSSYETIKGKTKKVTFEGSYKGSAVDAYGNLKAAFVAKTKISRKEFDLTWNKKRSLVNCPAGYICPDDKQDETWNGKGYQQLVPCKKPQLAFQHEKTNLPQAL